MGLKTLPLFPSDMDMVTGLHSLPYFNICLLPSYLLLIGQEEDVSRGYGGLTTVHDPGWESDLSAFQVCIGFIAFSIWNKGISVFLLVCFFNRSNSICVRGSFMMCYITIYITTGW